MLTGISKVKLGKIIQAQKSGRIAVRDAHVHTDPGGSTENFASVFLSVGRGRGMAEDGKSIVKISVVGRGAVPDELVGRIVGKLFGRAEIFKASVDENKIPLPCRNAFIQRTIPQIIEHFEKSFPIRSVQLPKRFQGHVAAVEQIIL